MRWISLISSGHSKSRIYLLLKCTWNILQIDHILGHKSNLSKFKNIEIISSIFSDHNAVRLDINYKKKKKKPLRNTNTWRLNIMFLNNQQDNEELKREIKKFLETNDNENTTTQKPMGCSKSSPKREVDSNTILPQETRKTLNRQTNFKPKTPGKRRTRNPHISRWKEIIKIRAVIHEIEMKQY